MSLPPRGRGDGAPTGEMAGAALPPMGIPIAPARGNEEMITSIMQMGISREAAQLVRNPILTEIFSVNEMLKLCASRRYNKPVEIPLKLRLPGSLRTVQE